MALGAVLAAAVLVCACGADEINTVGGGDGEAGPAWPSSFVYSIDSAGRLGQWITETSPTACFRNYPATGGVVTLSHGEAALVSIEGNTYTVKNTDGESAGQEWSFMAAISEEGMILTISDSENETELPNVVWSHPEALWPSGFTPDDIPEGAQGKMGTWLNMPVVLGVFTIEAGASGCSIIKQNGDDMIENDFLLVQTQGTLYVVQELDADENETFIGAPWYFSAQLNGAGDRITINNSGKSSILPNGDYSIVTTQPPN
ncbi:MAG: hypothetical protein LBC77_08445 [Spirochaetaceae bacterium]|jgi:hypothetical protein|nr:hypothetical protein [Spirochaetaceae bacterium]